jgi:hypothetical protein
MGSLAPAGGRRREGRPGGTERLEPRGPVRAGIAERLAALAAARGDGRSVLEARQAAWRADPTLDRLLHLVDVATVLGQREMAVAAEAGRAGDGPLGSRPELAAGMLLLAGRVDDPVALVEQADPLGWSHGRHPGPVVVQFLLVGGSDAPRAERWDELLLAELRRGQRRRLAVGPSGADEAVEVLCALVASDGDPLDRFRAIPRDDRLLSALLLDALGRRPFDAGERGRWLETARRQVEARVVDVVGGQHRGAYQRAAHLAAACAEALTLAGGEHAGRSFVDHLHERFPRHSAFRKELRSAVSGSPLLTPPAAGPRRR